MPREKTTTEITQIKEIFLDRTRGGRFGDSDWYEPWTGEKGRLFRALQKEYGGCTSKIYIDVPMGDGTFRTCECGWVFSKFVEYSDTREKYEREVWVEYKTGVVS